MELNSLLFGVLIFIVAFLYSSVGHGGASGYLAVLSFLSISPNQMSTTSLVLNILVSTISFIFYLREGYFSFKLTFPFILASVPAAFLGGLLHIEAKTYYLLLAIVLILASIRLFINLKEDKKVNVRLPKLSLTLSSGVGIGFISGIIGLGGGIFLSPLMILMKWADPKVTSASSAFFILVNSISGLCGKAVSNSIDFGFLTPFILFALVGGFSGSYLGSKKFSSLVLKRMLGIVLIIAALKLILKY
jgi:uncharacterized membrane protein YfcA